MSPLGNIYYNGERIFSFTLFSPNEKFNVFIILIFLSPTLESSASFFLSSLHFRSNKMSPLGNINYNGERIFSFTLFSPNENFNFSLFSFKFCLLFVDNQVRRWYDVRSLSGTSPRRSWTERPYWPKQSRTYGRS